MEAAASATTAWPDDKAGLATNTADIAHLLDMLPDDSKAFGTSSATVNQPAADGAAGSSSGQSSSGGSGASSPQREVDETFTEIVVPAPLPGAPSTEEMDMWECLMSLDGAPASEDVSATAPAFGRPSDCVSPAGWEVTAAASHIPVPVPVLVPGLPCESPVATPGVRPGARKSPLRAGAAATTPAKAKAATKAKAANGGPAAAKTTAAKPAAAAKAAAAAAVVGGLSPLVVSAEGGEAVSAALPTALASSAVGVGGDELSGKLDISAIDAELQDDEDGEGGEETAEEKRLRRMRRNRESAAMSRNRKKQYVEELEAQLAHLQEITRSLKTENFDLRREVARMHAGGGVAADGPVVGGGASGLLLRPPTLEGELTLEDGLLNPEDLISPILVPEATKPGGIVGVGVSAAAAPPPLPPLDDMSPLAPPPPPPAAAKRAGSPLLNSGAKRASTASLAFLSAVTLVTLSVNGAGAGRNGSYDLSGAAGLRSPRGHSPTARMLMSVSESVLPWKRPVPAAQYVPATPSEASAGLGLWPHLGLGPQSTHEQQHVATGELPPPSAAADEEDEVEVAAAPTPVATVPVPRGFAQRVIVAPRNSSWADVLKIEAAEKRLAEAQLELSALRQAQLAMPADATNALATLDTPASPSSSLPPPVYEYMPHADDEDDDDAAAAEEAQRFIFCARSYMFDRPAGFTPRGNRREPFDELELPKAMPPRFREAALYRHSQQQQEDERLARLPDGSNATPPADATNGPVLNILLPSAALDGVRGVPTHAAAGGRPAAAAEFTQVQCQVLNASRVAA